MSQMSQSQMSQQPQSGLGDEIYSGASSFGLVYSLIGAIIGTIVSVIMIIGGIYMLFKKVNTVPVSAKIVGVNCVQGQNDIRNCNINVTYTYNNKVENKYIQYSGNVIYTNNQELTVYVNKDNDSEVYIEQPSPKTIGSMLITFGLFILIGVWIWYWLTKKYKFLAAAQGVSGAYNLFRR